MITDVRVHRLPDSGTVAADEASGSSALATTIAISGLLVALVAPVWGQRSDAAGKEYGRQRRLAASGELLRSNAFSVAVTGAGSRVTHLAMDGMGAGHGVGFCQWGAVGRARTGQGYQQILAAYFPGTRVARRY